MKRRKNNNYNKQVLEAEKEKANKKSKIFFWFLLVSALLMLTVSMVFIMYIITGINKIIIPLIYSVLMSASSAALLMIYPYRDENDKKKNKLKLHALTLGYCLLAAVVTIIYILL